MADPVFDLARFPVHVRPGHGAPAPLTMRRLVVVAVVGLVLTSCASDGSSTRVDDDAQLLRKVVQDVDLMFAEVDVQADVVEQERYCSDSVDAPFVRLSLADGDIGRRDVVAYLRSYGWSSLPGAGGAGDSVLLRRYDVAAGSDWNGPDPGVTEVQLTLRTDEALVRVVDPSPCF